MGTMGFTVKTEVTDERLNDLLCSAMEGGSNYWYVINKHINPNNVKVEHPHLDLPFIEGCGLEIGDIEDDEAEPQILNRESIAKGLQVMADKYSHHFNNFMTENDDAETGDVFLQCCLFGDIVYG